MLCLSLTRDADASQTWRLVGWLAVVFIPFLAGGMLSNAAQLLNQYALADMTSSVIFIALAVVAIALSFAPRLLTLALTAVGVLISLVLANLSGTGTAEWQVTPVEFSEWGSATVLALVASGLGLGLYWQNSLAQVQQQDAASQDCFTDLDCTNFGGGCFCIFCSPSGITCVCDCFNCGCSGGRAVTDGT